MPRSPNKLKGEERRRQFLDAARILFAQKGFHKTTTAAIAGKVDVTEPVLYRHFRGKKDLFLTLLQEAHEEARKSWEALFAEPIHPVERLRKLLALNCGTSERPNGALVCRSILESDDPEVLALVRTHLNACMEFLSQAISQVKDAHCLTGDLDPAALATHLLRLEMGRTISQNAFGPTDHDGPDKLWRFVSPWVSQPPSAGPPDGV